MDRLWYTLDKEHRPVKADLETWAKWRTTYRRRRGVGVVGRTQINSNIWVSTVFLGCDHGFLSGGPPVLFETMVFGADGTDYQDYQKRYSSWDDAKTGHAVLVRKLRRHFRVVGVASNPARAE